LCQTAGLRVDTLPIIAVHAKQGWDI
jgi:hypothetical protein